MSMLISASESDPTICIDCGEPLHKSIKWGHIMGMFEHGSDFWSFARRFNYDRNHFKYCSCGALYLWSYDETYQNGGVWKRRHILPLFDLDIMRLSIVKHGRNDSIDSTYSDKVRW